MFSQKNTVLECSQKLLIILLQLHILLLSNKKKY